MRRLYLLAILLFPLISSAQISLGVTAGVNIGKFGGIEPPDASYTSRTGLNFGVTCAYRFNKDISFTLQPMYSQRGTNIDVGKDTFRDSLQIYETRIDYLIIPFFKSVQLFQYDDWNNYIILLELINRLIIV